MNMLRPLLAVALAAGLAACEGIGDGSTLKSLEIMPADFSEARPFKVYECLRDQLIVVGTFSDGTRADFSERAHWTTSDAGVATVSNGEMPLIRPSGPQFVTVSTTAYRSGTVTPVAPGSATITATFSALTASIPVTVGTPVFKLVPKAEGVDPDTQPPLMRSVAEGFLQPYTLMYTRPDGLTTFVSGLNPVLYRLVGGATSTDGAASVLPDSTNPKISVTTSLSVGYVKGIIGDSATYNIEAVTGLCQDRSTFMPQAPVRVSAFASTDPVDLTYEANFHDVNVSNRNFIAGTDQYLRVTANLANGDTHDISDQVDLEIEHTTPCTSGSSCACDSDGLNCKTTLLFKDRNRVFTIVTTEGEDALLTACITDLDADHFDDCEEHEAGDDVALLSDALPLHVVPVDFSSGVLSVSPMTASEQELTYPGFQFDAYATMTALSGFKFADADTDPLNDPVSHQQKVTRFVTWSTFAENSTTEASTLAIVRGYDDGMLGKRGRVLHLSNITTSQVVDIYAKPFAPFASVPATTAPAKLTITPEP